MDGSGVSNDSVFGLAAIARSVIEVFLILSLISGFFNKPVFNLLLKVNLSSGNFVNYKPKAPTTHAAIK